jgi:hypothetical protein
MTKTVIPFYINLNEVVGAITKAKGNNKHVKDKEFLKQYIIIPSKTGFILSTRACHLSLSMAHRNPYKYMMQNM